MSMRQAYDEIRGFLVQAHGVASREIKIIKEEAAQTMDYELVTRLLARVDLLFGILENIESLMRSVPLLPPPHEDL